MGICYEPSSLINWVHEEVPFIQIGFNNSGQGAEELIDSLDEGLAGYYDYFIRAVIWGSVVTVACILLLVSVCVWNCCTVCLCKRSKGDSTRLKVAKFLCGALLLLPALLSVCVLGVGVWAEVQFSWHIRDNIDGVQSFLSNVSSISDGSAGSDTSSSDTLSLLFEFESSKHWIFIGYFSFLFLPLIGVIIAILCTTLCKHPATMIIMVILLMIVSFSITLVVGLATALLIFYSDICVGLHYKQLHDVTHECLLELTDYSSTLDNFCNNGYLHGVIMAAAAATLVLTYGCMQLSGSCYAGLQTGYRGGVQIQPLNNEEDNHELRHFNSPQPNPPTAADHNTADTTALLSSMTMEPMAEDVQQYLCDQPTNPRPSAPPDRAPAPTIRPPPPSDPAPPSTSLQSPSNPSPLPLTSKLPSTHSLPSKNPWVNVDMQKYSLSVSLQSKPSDSVVELGEDTATV